MATENGYSDDFWNGARAAIALIRAGSSPEDIEAVLPAGGPVDPAEYQSMLQEIRATMGTDAPALFGGGPMIDFVISLAFAVTLIVAGFGIGTWMGRR
jgi:hypothetical protein